MNMQSVNDRLSRIERLLYELLCLNCKYPDTPQKIWDKITNDIVKGK